MPTAFKLFEKSISEQLASFYDNIFSNYQLGFRKGYRLQSTTTPYYSSWIWKKIVDRLCTEQSLTKFDLTLIKLGFLTVDFFGGRVGRGSICRPPAPATFIFQEEKNSSYFLNDFRNFNTIFRKNVLMIILKVRKKQDFTLSLEDRVLEKPQGWSKWLPPSLLKGNVPSSLILISAVSIIWLKQEKLNITRMMQLCTLYTVENKVLDIITSLEKWAKILFKRFDNNFMKENSEKGHLLLSKETALVSSTDGDVVSNSK